MGKKWLCSRLISLLNRKYIIEIRVISGLLAACFIQFVPTTVWAVPSFATQTGQPCAACHVGSFGPRLTQFGRDFKMFGYSATDGKKHFLPLAAVADVNFTNTKADQAGGAAPGYGANNNFTLGDVALYYAGRIAANFGAFIETKYDGVTKKFAWDDIDVRYAREGSLFGADAVFGVTVNNNPSVQDLWNTTPTWSYPFNSSGLAPAPRATTLIDGTLGHKVAGVGAYMQWNDLLFLEFTSYRGLGRDTRDSLGIPARSVMDDSVNGFIPYWRASLQREFEDGRHYVHAGTFGLTAEISPMSFRGAGVDKITDVGFDAGYQWRQDPNDVASDMLTLQFSYVRERLSLDASQGLSGTNARDNLTTFRADLSYSFGATYTPTIQWFKTVGSNDAARWGTANGSPNSSGWTLQLDYVPWGKQDSPIRWGNMRLSTQYVIYTQFDGTRARASDNNTLFILMQIALGAP